MLHTLQYRIGEYMAKNGKSGKNGRKQKTEDYSEEGKRLNRIMGQLEGIRRMMDDGRGLEDILIQCKAVHSALKSIEMRLLRTHIEDALSDLSSMDKRRDREEAVGELVDLFRPV